jgi:hypothetical protein
MEHTRQIDGVRGLVQSLDDKISRQFMWLVGIQVTTFVALLTALSTR